MKGARAVLELLEGQGVDVMFGYPGGVTIPLYDELLDSSIHHVLVRHEQCAAHTFLAPESAVTVTISSGLLTVSDTGNLNEKDLIGKVDKLLYEAKHRGRNQICAES